jgi:hypothetical protein
MKALRARHSQRAVPVPRTLPKAQLAEGGDKKARKGKKGSLPGSLSVAGARTEEEAAPTMGLSAAQQARMDAIAAALERQLEALGGSDEADAADIQGTLESWLAEADAEAGEQAMDYNPAALLPLFSAEDPANQSAAAAEGEDGRPLRRSRRGGGISALPQVPDELLPKVGGCLWLRQHTATHSMRTQACTCICVCSLNVNATYLAQSAVQG